MKNDVMHASAQVDQFIIRNVVDIKETVATNFELSKHANRTFGIYDLWNIRRNAKFASSRVRRS